MLRPTRTAALVLGLAVTGCFSPRGGGAGPDGSDGGGDGGAPGPDARITRDGAFPAACAEGEFCTLIDPFDTPLSEGTWTEEGGGCSFLTEGGALIVSGATTCKLSSLASYAISPGGLRFAIDEVPSGSGTHVEVGIEDELSGEFAGFVVRPTLLGVDYQVNPGTYQSDPAPRTPPAPPYDLILRLADGLLVLEVDVGGVVTEQRHLARPAFGAAATAYIYLVGDGGAPSRFVVGGVNAP